MSSPKEEDANSIEKTKMDSGNNNAMNKDDPDFSNPEGGAKVGSWYLNFDMATTLILET